MIFLAKIPMLPTILSRHRCPIREAGIGNRRVQWSPSPTGCPASRVSASFPETGIPPTQVIPAIPAQAGIHIPRERGHRIPRLRRALPSGDGWLHTLDEPRIRALFERTFRFRVDRLLLYWTSEARKEDALMTLPYRPERVDEAGRHFDAAVERIRAGEFAVTTPPEAAIRRECDQRAMCRAEGVIGNIGESEALAA